MKSRAYLFDMDGVLVDNCHYHVLSWLELAKRHGGHVTEAEIIAWMGAPAQTYIERMFDMLPSPECCAEMVSEKEALYRELYRPHLEPCAGLVDFLHAARADGISCAVVTGGSKENVSFVLDGLGIRDCFSCVVDASQYERGKPAPDCYLQAADRLGVVPGDCVVFEDAVNGIRAAQAAGMRVVAFTTTNVRRTLEDAHPDRIVADFRALTNPV